MPLKDNFTQKDRERLAASFGLAMGVHILFFLIFSFVKWETAEPTADFSGPIYVTLNSSEQDTKDSLSIAKSESLREKPAQQQAAPKKDAMNMEPPIVNKKQTNPKEKQPDKPQEKSDTQKTTNVQKEKAKGEAPVTKTETSEEHVPQDSEKYVPGDKKIIAGEDSEAQVPNNSILESDKLSQLEKVLNQSNGVNGYSGNSSGNQNGTGKTGTGNGNSPNTGGAGPIQWEDPGQARKIISQPKPDIPDWVGKQGIDLKVIFSFVVTPEGYLTNIKLVKSSGYTDVDQAISSALARMQFQPTANNKLAKATIPYAIQPN